jgi:hypothetical protein
MCVECNKQRQKDYYQKTKHLKRYYHLKKRYNLDKSQYAALRRKQKGKCAICGAPVGLVVDHDHNTGVIRGLLCHLCNTGIGKLKDSPKLVKRALWYLKRKPPKV